MVKRENKKEFWDAKLACDDEQIYAPKVITTFLFYCDKCAETFLFEDELKEHMWTHIETQNNSCNICNKLFSLKHKQKEHMKKNTNKFSLEYYGPNVRKNWGLEVKSFLQKHGQNFIFQVF